VTAKMPEVERWSRIVCHFPLNRLPNRKKPNQIRVVREFIQFLKGTALTGFTMSSLLENVCTGFWRPEPIGAFDEENIVLIAIDHPLDKNDAELWEFVATMKVEIQRLYKRYAGAKEQEIWIVVHSIDRLA
jgi:hypothetical protein